MTGDLRNINFVLSSVNEIQSSETELVHEERRIYDMGLD